MKYANFGNTGIKVSRFGFGCMRFPQKTVNGERMIDQEEVNRMVRYAIDHGVNYFDSAHSYPGSETALGIALEGGWREKAFVVGKNPVFNARREKDLNRFLQEELDRLQTSYLDLQLLHSLNGELWKKCLEMDALAYLDEMKAKGKLRHAGFSFHGRLEDFKMMVDAYAWDMVQIQLNFLDIKHQAGLEGMEYAAGKGIPVVIMEPLRGGAMVNSLPEEVKREYDTYPVKRSAAEWSFRWLIDLPEVTTVLSGVSTMEQLQENIRIFSDTDTGCMTREEHQLIDRVVEAFNNRRIVDCTRCGYCMPCPYGVNIPEIFQLYNDMIMEGYQSHLRFTYRHTMMQDEGSGADRCTECGECETRCPQTIPIIGKLKEAHGRLVESP